MLDITPIKSANAAKEYYFAGNRADYYLGAKEKPGLWHGKVAEMMGLKGTVKKEDFAALCDHINPITGEPLTLRKNENRRIGFDLCYGPPKSVSAVHALTGDHRIQLALEGAFADTIEQIEKDALTRVRIKGQDIDRPTGNLICAQFTHKHSRPTERDDRVLPDPHLHCHGVIFNVTFDPVEERWKAAQLGDIKRDGKYFQECMQNRLIRRLQKLGYQIQQTSDGWEIAGISREVIKKFSQRTQDVKLARDEEEKDLGKKLSIKQAAQLGKRTRKLKKDGEQLNELELKQIWRKRLTPEEFISVQECFHQAKIQERIVKQYELESNSRKFAQKGADYAKNVHFATKSVMDKRMLIAEAIKASYGEAHFETIEEVVKESDLLTYEENGRTWCTTPQVREEERYFVKFAREGHLMCEAFNNTPDLQLAKSLSDQQTLAYQQVLTSRDRVIGICGKAGTGKTTMMQQIVKAIEQSGNDVKTFAPSHGAVEVLCQEGFNNSDTIQQFLINEELQENAQGCVLWVDEAGLLSSSQMAKLASIAKRQNCRVILSGDTSQHSGVERGDAMRILENHGGLRSAQLDQIFRQKDPTYNDAIRHLSDGEIEKAFEKFDTLNSIHEINDVDRPKELATQLIHSRRQGRTALVVSPTNREADDVTHYIRRGMVKMNMLTGISMDYQRLKSLRFTTAELTQARNYQLGQIIEPHANMDNRKLPIGKPAKVVEVEGKTVWVENHKSERLALDLSHAEKFDLFEERGLYLMRGDQIKITRTGRTTSGKKIANGTIAEVAEITAKGEIVLKSGETLPPDFKHIDHGYCVTSYSSQGRTVDDVFIAESSMSFPAASLEQFYVSCSRGRERLRIFTDDKNELKRAISRSCARKSAHDYDWDAQAKLRSRNPEKLQSLARDSQYWAEHFDISPSTPPPDVPAPTQPTLPPTSPVSAHSIIPQPILIQKPKQNHQPSIEIDR